MVSWLLQNKNLKQTILSIWLGMVCSFSYTQNLVPNPSFEDTISCPYTNGQSCPNTNIGSFDAIFFWTNPICTTPEVFHACAASGGVSTPNNLFGYQLPHSGSAYAGLCSNMSFIPKPNNEYILSPLSQPLLSGKKYLVSFWVSFTRDGFNPTLWNGSNAVGALLSVGWPDTTGSGVNEKINATAQVNNPYNIILNDTVNWVLISDTISAAGGEDHITIGNFTPDSLEQGDGAYFYVDDVSVVEYIPPPNSYFVPTAFSPNNDGKNDILFVRGENIASIDFHVFDRWGQEVFVSRDKAKGWDGSFKGVALGNAVFMYYANVTYGDGTTQIIKGNVTLVR